MSDAADRMLPASPRRREAARRQGMLPAAGLPAWAAAAATTLLLLPAGARATWAACVELLRQAIPAAVAAPDRPPGLAEILPVALLGPVAALIFAAAAAAVAVRLLCDGFSWVPARVLPAPERIDPVRGLARILSGRTLAAALAAGLGLVVMVVAAAFAAGPLVALQGAVPDAVAAGHAAHRTLAVIVVVAAVVATLQWLAARMRFERQIRMTPQEAIEEQRDAQADPRIRLLTRNRSRRSAA